MLIDVQPGEFVFANVACLGVYDGDTIYLDIDVGFSFRRSNRSRSGKLRKGYRLLDVDAPELKPLVTRQAGTEARDYLAGLIGGKQLFVRTYESPVHDQDDDFGRYLAWVRVFDGTPAGFDVNRAMIDSGHAVPYRP